MIGAHFRGVITSEGLAAGAPLGERRGVARFSPRSLAKLLVPAGARRWLRLTLGWRWLRGDYATWAQARAQSAGYDAPVELERYTAAARTVEQGRAAWERDAMVFAEPAVNAPLLAALRASTTDGRLEVVDFGGALGSTWRQHRQVLSDMSVRWRIVEQPAWVEAGQREFASETLGFHRTLVEAATEPSRQVLLLSSVLQYLENPAAVIDEAVALGFGHVIVDRVLLWRGGRDRLTVQHTPVEYGGGSYPCWVFDEEKLRARLGRTGRLVEEWDGLDDLAAWVHCRGWHFAKA